MSMEIVVESGLGARHRRPFVMLALGNEERTLVARIEPAEARRIGIQLLEAAAAAMADATVIEVAGGEKLTTEEAGALLQRARAHRAAVEQRTGDAT